MTARRAPARRASAAAFWDTSAIVPLCCFQPQSAPAARLVRLYARQITWWTTPVEAASSFNRLQREGAMTATGKIQALARLEHLRRRWHEIQPVDDVRDRAERLLGLHTLRAADALQLAAALVWCSDTPRGRHFVAADGHLTDAAEAEGFTVVRIN